MTEKENIDELSARAELLVICGIRKDVALSIDAFADIEEDDDAYFMLCDARMNKLHSVDGYNSLLKDNESVIANFSFILREFGFDDGAIGVLKPPSKSSFRDWVINWVYSILCHANVKPLTK